MPYGRKDPRTLMREHWRSATELPGLTIGIYIPFKEDGVLSAVEQLAKLADCQSITITLQDWCGACYAAHAIITWGTSETIQPPSLGR